MKDKRKLMKSVNQKGNREKKTEIRKKKQKAKEKKAKELKTKEAEINKDKNPLFQQKVAKKLNK